MLGVRGIYTAIVTPLTDADEVDEAAFRKLIDFQIAAGAAGLLVVGGSGEFVSLTPSERERVIDVAIEQVERRIPVVVGALAPGTREVQDTVRYAVKAGAADNRSWCGRSAKAGSAPAPSTKA